MWIDFSLETKKRLCAKNTVRAYNYTASSSIFWLQKVTKCHFKGANWVDFEAFLPFFSILAIKNVPW